MRGGGEFVVDSALKHNLPEVRAGVKVLAVDLSLHFVCELRTELP